MWLLSTDRAELYPFPDPFQVPDGGYAILSHVWGTDEQTFQDVQALASRCKTTGQNPRDLVGAKIREFCVLAAQHGYQWAWIDTCCIDKTSSAELSEAINSMFGFYSAADVCFVYLHDVPSECGALELALGAPGSAFRRSRWHTRGWTLQEMVAPCFLLFFSAEWRRLGDRRELAGLLAEISGVDEQFLVARGDLGAIPVARRMRWAAHRQTTRYEDQAYCLLGIFHITMPILYGEGWRAFLRLQEEIVKRYNDLSIFAWGPCLESSALRALEVASLENMRDIKSTAAAGVFASVPSQFSEHPVPACSSSGTATQLLQKPRGKLARAVSSCLNVRSNSSFGLPRNDVQGPGFPTFRTTPYGGLMHALVLESSGITVALLEYLADGSPLGLLLHPYGNTECFAITCGFVENGRGPLTVFRLAVVDDAFCKHFFKGKRPKARWLDVHLLVVAIPPKFLYYLPPIPSVGGGDNGGGPPFWLSSTVFDRLFTTWGFLPFTSACCIDPASDHVTYTLSRGLDTFVLSMGRCPLKSAKGVGDERSCGWVVAFPLPDGDANASAATSSTEKPGYEAVRCGEHRCPDHHIPHARVGAATSSTSEVETRTFGDDERTIKLTFTRSTLFAHPVWRLSVELAGSVYDGYARSIARTAKSTAPALAQAQSTTTTGKRTAGGDGRDSSLLTLSWAEVHNTALTRWRDAVLDQANGKPREAHLPASSASRGSSMAAAAPSEHLSSLSVMVKGCKDELASCLVPSPYHRNLGP
ncbi:HET-domain-containing protein [Cubamyces sp. BRFM 1775]|nr:HET-domain-containing protein [Cubamyces sp. BRFM 1775]